MPTIGAPLKLTWLRKGRLPDVGHQPRLRLHTMLLLESLKLGNRVLQLQFDVVHPRDEHRVKLSVGLAHELRLRQRLWQRRGKWSPDVANRREAWALHELRRARHGLLIPRETLRRR